MRKTVLISALLAALTASTAGFAGPEHGRGHHPGMFNRLDRMSEVLDLSEAQYDAISAIYQEAREAKREMRRQQWSNRSAISELLASGDYSESELMALAQVQGDLVAQEIVNKANVHAQIQAQLTEEQIAELEALKAERKDKRKKRKFRRRNRG